MFARHQIHTQQAPSARGHRPDTMAGYLALQREGDLARAAARSHQALDASTGTSPLLRALATAASNGFRELLARATATTDRPAPERALPRLGTAQRDLTCCA